MKHMTNTQIDEINRLLTDHREALTAFWDEAFYYGMRSGYKWVLCGAAIAVVARGVGETVIRSETSERTRRSPDRDSFFCIWRKPCVITLRNLRFICPCMGSVIGATTGLQLLHPVLGGGAGPGGDSAAV